MNHLLKSCVTFLTFTFLGSAQAKAQSPQYAYRIDFGDKNATEYQLSNPVAFLSQRAIDRRSKFMIGIDSTDLPVPSSYISSVLNITSGVLHSSSRWLNNCVVLVEDTSQVQSLLNLGFVQGLKKVGYFSSGLHQRPAGGEENDEMKPTDFDENFYGSAWQQIHLHNGEYLHEKGNSGEGMLIAVIDIGFTDIDNNPAFDSMFQQGRLWDTWNYIYDTSYVFDYGVHGCMVLSCMASYMPQQHVGTAYLANYALYATDHLTTEQAIEEDNLTAAMERADSIGADLISTSLGYNEFDNPADSYVYADLDGKTTRSAQVANIASAKGIVVIASAGNEGTSPWQHILTPGDADSVITVGSVDGNKIGAPTSGSGPNAAGILKPNVCAKGVQASVINTGGTVVSSSGTSYATPIIAGLTACLMQSAPDLDPYQIRKLLESVSHAANNPDNEIGMGVPDFKLAYDEVNDIDAASINDLNLSVFPNPATDKIFLQSQANEPNRMHLGIYDIQGRKLRDLQVNFSAGRSIVAVDLNGLSNGLYYLHAISKKGTASVKFIKR